jgi:hypothetical protein
MPQQTVDAGTRELDSRNRAGQPEEGSSLWSRLAAVVAQDAFVNLLVVAALGIGFFHGWLKLRFRSPITTFAYDIVLILALVVVYLRSGSIRRFFPPGPTTHALMAFYGLCLAYLPFSLIPGMPPFLVALSTLRGWIFATLLYGLGYQIIRGRAQLHGYFLVILTLALLTALYGIQQSDAEVLQMMKEDPFFARRYRGQGYVDAEGDFHVRRFSTFISSGAFGATMGTSIILGSALFLAPSARRFERVVIASMMIPIGYGMVLSGSRSAVIIALTGCAVLLAVRRKLIPGLVILGVIAAGVVMASQATGGGVLDRLATLNVGNIFYRFWWPTYLGLDFMLGHPLGGGLGKTGFSPTFLLNLSNYSDYLAPDGDLGRLMVEFGVLGILLFGRLSWNAAKLMFETVKLTHNLPSGSLILAAATNLWISIAFVGVGSPFVGIPMGVLVWFFVGAAQRLREIETADPTALQLSVGQGRTRASAIPAAAPEVSRRPGKSSRRNFLFLDSRRDDIGSQASPSSVDSPAVSAASAPDRTEATRLETPAKPPVKNRKVFLYGNPARGDRQAGRSESGTPKNRA